MPLLPDDASQQKRSSWLVPLALGVLAALFLTAVVVPFVHPVFVHLPNGGSVYVAGRFISPAAAPAPRYRHLSLAAGPTARIDTHTWRVGPARFFIQLATPR